MSQERYSLQISWIFIHFVAVGWSSCKMCEDWDSQAKVQGPTGYIAGLVSQTIEGCGSTRCPWLVQVRPGQVINLTLYDFYSPTASGSAHLSDPARGQQPARPRSQSSDMCQRYATVKERANPRDAPVCAGKGRHRVFYTSVSNFLEVHVLDPGGRFLIYYEGKLDLFDLFVVIEIEWLLYILSFSQASTYWMSSTLSDDMRLKNQPRDFHKFPDGIRLSLELQSV